MHRLKIISPYLIILALLFAAYSNAFKTGFHYDDAVNITKNGNIHLAKINWQNIKNTFFAGGERGDIYHPILYRPVSMLSFALNYYAHGLNPFWFHAVNFAIHTVTALFLYLFVIQLLSLPRFNYPDKNLIAFLAAAMWALNPIQLTAVTYIVQRMTSLAGMFYVMAMYFYLKARAGGSLKYAVIAFLCASAGIMSKENAIMVFFAVAVFDVMFFEHKNLKRDLYFAAMILMICAIFIIAVQGPETFSLEKLQAGYAKRDFTLGQRLLTEPRVIVFYLMLLIFPSHNLMSLTHNVPISTGLLSPPETLFSIAIIASLIGLAVLQSRKNPILAFALLFFFMNHVIEGSIFPLELVYEHRNYVPSMLLFLPVSILIVSCRHKFKMIPAAATAACILTFLTWNTYQQNRAWESDLSLWTDTVSKSPDPRSMFNLGGAYYTKYRKSGDRTDFDEAVKYFKISRDFNQIYGTNYSEDWGNIPFGRVMFMAQHNTKLMTMKEDGRIRRGWAVPDELIRRSEVEKNDG